MLANGNAQSIPLTAALDSGEQTFVFKVGLAAALGLSKFVQAQLY